MRAIVVSLIIILTSCAAVNKKLFPNVIESDLGGGHAMLYKMWIEDLINGPKSMLIEKPVYFYRLPGDTAERRTYIEWSERSRQAAALMRGER